MAESTAQKLRNKFNILHEDSVRRLREALGVRPGSIELEQVIEKEMGEGNLTYVVRDGSKDGVWGNLHYLTTEEDGRKVMRNKEITNQGDSDYLLGLQIQSDRKKH